MSTQLAKPIEFVGKISKFTGDRKVICIPGYITERLPATSRNQHFRIRIEEY